MVMLPMSDHGIVIGAAEPRIEGMTVVTSIGLKLIGLVVVTLATKLSAGDAVVLTPSILRLIPGDEDSTFSADR